LQRIGRNTVLSMIALSLIGVLTVHFVAKQGIGNTADAAVYIGVADSLLRGQGLNVPFGQAEPYPMTHFPPLFPALIAAVGFFGMDPQNAAKWIQSFLFGANIFLVGVIIKKNAPGSLWASLCGCFIILSSMTLFRIHLFALSEPLFIFLGFLGLFLLAEYSHNARKSFLIAAATAIGLAALTRYIGVALIATGAVGVLLHNSRTYPRRIRDSIAFSVISSYPMALWLIRNYHVSGSGTDRTLVAHPISLVHIKYALRTISIWILPDRIPGITAGIILLLAVSGLLFLNITRLRKEGSRNGIDKNERPSESISFLLCIFIFFYFLILVVSISYFDVLVFPTDRMLSPVFVSLVILIPCQLHTLLMRLERKALLKTACISFFVILSGYYVHHGIVLIRDVRSNGLLFENKVWPHSEIVKAIEAIPPEVPIFTNGPEIIYMLTDRSYRWLPSRWDPFSLQTNRDYFNEIAAMRHKLVMNNGRLVYFNRPRYFERRMGSEDELKALLQLDIVMKSPEGSIYKLPQ